MQCPKCKTELQHREGVKKETGKAWSGEFCTNPDCNHVIWNRIAQAEQPKENILRDNQKMIYNKLLDIEQKIDNITVTKEIPVGEPK